MKITRLSVAGLRAFEQAQFEFDPAFTLLVGINGAGKTTVLETLRISLSRLLPKFTASKSRPDTFSADDIRVGASALTVELDLSVNGETHHLLIHKQREQSVPHKDGVVREQTLATPDRETLSPDFGRAAKALKTAKAQPIAVYFATRRSIVSDVQSEPKKPRGPQAAAYTNALLPRRLRLPEMASWMHAQEALARELPRAGLHLEALRDAARRFLPECEDLRAEVDDQPRMLVEKQGRTLDVRQLSDGERSMLALVLDLARRLSQANPGLDDPVRDGAGVVLIDEIDLHLHPQWQRRVVGNLEETFPNCQFIATTHSPQVIGEVPHDKIRLIKDGNVYPPSRSFGIDSSRVLEEVMDTKARNAGVEDKIGEIARLIGDGEANEARAAIKMLSDEIGEDDPEITRARTLLDFMEGDA
jgi:predicted ATP-binding protein involved in virulence